VWFIAHKVFVKIPKCELVWKTYKVDSEIDSAPSKSLNVDVSLESKSFRSTTSDSDFSKSGLLASDYLKILVSTLESDFYLLTKNFSFSSKCHVLSCMFMQIFNLRSYPLEHTLANPIYSFNILLSSKLWRHWTNPFYSNTDVALSHFPRDKPGHLLHVCWLGHGQKS
jgi:hypothetical protein